MSAIRNTLSFQFMSHVRSLSAKFRSVSNASYILNSGLPDVAVPSVSIPEFVFSKCVQYERLTAIECGITGRKYTYGELSLKSKTFGASLRKKLGLSEEDVVAIFLPNVPEFSVAALGVLYAGLIITSVNPVYTQDEISRQLRDSSAKAIITLVDLYEVANASCNLLSKKLPIITIKTKVDQSTPQGAVNFTEYLQPIEHPELQPRDPQDLAFLPYSSGTTGLPKGVQLTHHNIVANVVQKGAPELQLIQQASDEQEVVPSVLPNFHIYGFTINTLYPLSKGAKLVTLPKFTPGDYLNVLRKHKPSFLYVAPPMVLFLAGHPMVKVEDLDSVRIVFSGAAPLGALDEQRLVDKAEKHIHFLQGYGMTESAPGIAVSTIPQGREFNIRGSVGRPLPNTLIKVINMDDAGGTPLGPNCQGELLLKGPQVMKGYLNRPEDTEKTFLDGWLRTGDLVYYNEDGLIFVTDRLKELIKVKGFQVAPAELEEIIRDFPNVEDAAVIGVPHPSLGEVPRAFIVPKKNAKVNTKDLEEYVKSKVASYKQLKGGVSVLDSIPKNPSGKILRRMLKQEATRK